MMDATTALEMIHRGMPAGLQSEAIARARQLLQTVPADPDEPWMWIAGLLALAVGALFAALLKALTDSGNQWRSAAEAAQKEMPLTRETLNKAVDTLARQVTLIEKLEDMVATLARSVEANARVADDINAGLTRVERQLDELRPRENGPRRRSTGD